MRKGSKSTYLALIVAIVVGFSFRAVAETINIPFDVGQTIETQVGNTKLTTARVSAQGALSQFGQPYLATGPQNYNRLITLAHQDSKEPSVGSSSELLGQFADLRTIAAACLGGTVVTRAYSIKLKGDSPVNRAVYCANYVNGAAWFRLFRCDLDQSGLSVSRANSCILIDENASTGAGNPLE